MEYVIICDNTSEYSVYRVFNFTVYTPKEI